MAEVVIDFVIEAALSKTLSTIEEQIKLAWDFKEELKQLQSSLKMTGAFLRDAQTRQVDEPVRFWLEELGGIVRKADDLLDELAYEDLRRKVDTRKRTKVKNLFSPSKNPMAFTLKMAKKVRAIKLSLKNVNCQAFELGLQDRVTNAAPVYSGAPEIHAFVGSSGFVGRADDVQKIVGLLTAGSATQQTFSIVSIEGMAGLGKTTLAKSVATTEKVKNHFNKIIEVCVSENFGVHRILQEMVESLTGQTCDMKNRDAILKKIGEELKGRAYLLVLDDVWDEALDNWEDLRACLLQINECNQCSCSILVTTRNVNVAVVGESPPENRHRLKELKDDECWSIIKERSFGNCSISSKLEDIGREIACKCRGVPLVAAIIGGTMRNNPNINLCESIRDDPLWASLEKNNDWAVRVLKLSFDRLSSPSLKQCFAYCSIFPKDFDMEKEQLIQLWMAEGFLQQSGGSSQQACEDIASMYFDNLLSNSLLQDVKRDMHGCIRTCKMHDLVHDLAQSISKAKVFAAEPCFPSNLVELNLWRSSFVAVERFQSSSSFRGLRVLKFIGASLISLPDSISNLKLLRYFDISETDIGEVTESISKLYLLQTLRLLDCKRLKRLPQGMKNLVSLRHLCFNNEMLVLNGIDGLTNLQTLPMFNVRGEGGCGIGELENLSELRGELRIFNLQNVRNKEEAREAKLLHKKNLTKLNFEWDEKRIEDCSHEEEVLEGLEPHSNLKSLTINYYGGVRIPSWLERKSRVSDPNSCFQLIKLEGLIFLNCHFLNLPTLGLYPNLKFLVIGGLNLVRSIGKEFYIDDNGCDGGDELFPALETFSLEFMDGLEEWLIEKEPTMAVFPSLKELRIRGCDKLNRVPMMCRFSSLEMLEITRCHELCWTRELEEADGVFPSTLKFLKIDSCNKLRYIPGVKGGISSLRELKVGLCNELSGIGETLLASTCLREVNIGPCLNLECIPLSRGSKSTRLERLMIKICPTLTSISNLDGFSFLSTLQVYGCHGLTSLPSGLQTCTSLQSLSIQDCNNLTSIPSLDGFSFLSTLELHGCQGLTSLPSGLQTCTSLQFLSIQDCSNLSSIPSLDGFSFLSTLKVHGCQGLTSLPSGLETCTSLQSLSILDCSNLTSIPSLDVFSFLSTLLLIRCQGLTSLPSGLETCTSLQSLSILDCSNMESFPEGQSLGCLTRLKSLTLGPFSKELDEFPLLSSIPNLRSSLELLHLSGWETLSSLPHQLQHLTALKELQIYDFDGVKAFPDWLGNLSSLRNLCILDCKNLDQVPSKEAMQRLSNLKEVVVRRCPRLKKNTDEFWASKIDYGYA